MHTYTNCKLNDKAKMSDPATSGAEVTLLFILQEHEQIRGIVVDFRVHLVIVNFCLQQ